MSRFKLWITGGTLASLLGLMVLAAATPAGAHGLGGDPRGAGQRAGVVQATLQLRPTSGPAGTLVRVKGTGFAQFWFCPPSVSLSFIDADGVETSFGSYGLTFKTRITIPDGASVGAGSIVAKQWLFLHDICSLYTTASATFTVTP